MIAHQVFGVLVVCSAVIIAPANAGPMNFLRVVKGDKKTNHSVTTRLQSATTGVTFVASTVVMPSSSNISTRVAMDVAPKQSPPINGVGPVVGHENKKNKCDSDNSAMIQRLCSAVMYAATMPQLRSKGADVTAGSVGTYLPPSSQSPLKEVTPAKRRHHRVNKSFRKRFSPAGYGSGLHEWFGATMRPADRYRDPILAQETSRGVDYLTSYPLTKGAEDDEKYYEDAERPAEVWKIKVVGEPMAKSLKNSAATAAAADDDDDEDDETAIADESR